MMKNLNITLPYVECGVFEGHHIDHVKSIWGGECIGIDTYKSQSDHQYPDGSNVSQSHFDKIFASVSERHRIIRDDSILASSSFQDGSVGCVYLDSNHGYRHVTQELNAWWPKVADGGILAGDDFRTGLSEDKSTWFAVSQAVMDFTKKNNLALFRTSDGLDWYILKRGYYTPDEIVVISNFHGNFWPDCIKDNHRKYCEHFGYTYEAMSLPPPPGTDPQWSKISAIQKTWDMYPEKKIIWWIDADIVFTNPIPLHIWSLHGFDLIGGAYKIQGFYEGLLNTCWFGVRTQPHMREVIDRSLNYREYARRYPHEEGALTKILSPRANDNILLEDVHHIAPSTFWGSYSHDSWMQHIIGMHGKARLAILEDCCAMAKL
jgi:hypothetical protein